MVERGFMKRAILGAGMSGLILAEIFRQNNPNEEVKIFTKDILGQQKYDFDLGPRILHQTNAVQAFLGEMYPHGGFSVGGAPSAYKVFKIGYINENEELVEESEIDAVKYAEKCGKIYEKSTMSGGKSEIRGWDIRKLDLPKTLYRRHAQNIEIANLTKDKIEEIKEEYSKVYCTIPLSALNKMYGLKDETKVEHSVFVLFDKPFEFSNFDYVYDVSDRPIKRITNSNGKSVYELIGVTERSVEAITDIARDYKILDTVIDKIQIQRSLPIEKFEGMDMVGRFATNNHAERMDTIIEKYLRY